MRRIYTFWQIFDDPVVQGFAFSLWGVPLYIFIKWLPTLVDKYYHISILLVTEDDQGILEGFIEWFGVPYGLVLALVLVNVWNQFESTERAFDREGDALLTLFHTFQFIHNNSIKIDVGKKMRDYAFFVRTNQDTDNSTVNSYPNKQEIILRELRECISKLLRRSKNSYLPMKLLDLTNKLIDYRGDRISYSRQRLPSPVKYLSFAASIAWLVPFFALKFDNPLIGPFLIVAVILVVVSILLIIEDLDKPIGGAWEVNFDPWKKIETEIDNEIKILENVSSQ